MSSRLPDRIVIATRRSRLALWQAEHVRARLRQHYPALQVELLALSTRGDELLDVKLDQVGGKGLFIKELEVAMAQSRADCAVHSMKDLPADLPDGFRLVAIMAREDARDAFVSSNHARFEALPQGAVLGTASLRRATQLAERRPDLRIRTVRGNVETRLAKLDRGEYDALVLAAAGLIRLGLSERIAQLFEVRESLPAAGQGALGIECRSDRDDLAQLFAPFEDARAGACVRAEREVSRALGGSCTLPLAAYAESAGTQLHLRALIGTPDGVRVVRAEGRGADPIVLGAQVARSLLAAGAADVLESLGVPVPSN